MLLKDTSLRRLGAVSSVSQDAEQGAGLSVTAPPNSKSSDLSGQPDRGSKTPPKGTGSLCAQKFLKKNLAQSLILLRRLLQPENEAGFRDFVTGRDAVPALFCLDADTLRL